MITQNKYKISYDKNIHIYTEGVYPACILLTYDFNYFTYDMIKAFKHYTCKNRGITVVPLINNNYSKLSQEETIKLFLTNIYISSIFLINHDNVTSIANSRYSFILNGSIPLLVDENFSIDVYLKSLEVISPTTYKNWYTEEVMNKLKVSFDERVIRYPLDLTENIIKEKTDIELIKQTELNNLKGVFENSF